MTDLDRRALMAAVSAGVALSPGKAQAVLVGRDLVEIDVHLKNGMIRWGGIEEAIWDAIGRIAAQPVSRLLGGTATTQPVYVTYVWPGTNGQETITPRTQAEQAKI